MGRQWFALMKSIPSMDQRTKKVREGPWDRARPIPFRKGAESALREGCEEPSGDPLSDVISLRWEATRSLVSHAFASQDAGALEISRSNIKCDGKDASSAAGNVATA